MSDNTPEIPVLVTYYTNSKILCKKEFGSFAHFGSVLNYFERNIKNNNSQINLKQKYFLNDKEIEDNDLLINLIQSLDKNKNKNQIITEANLSIEIEEKQKNNLGFEKTSIYSKILQPKSSPFGIYILNPKDYSIFLKQFSFKEEIDNELNKLNENSAYCNSTNDLYVSGGIYNNNCINNFWIINNESFGIKKLNMKYPKANHSMIYINHNDDELIFVAGGDDLKTFYYNIENKKFVNWGNMNYKHFRPALIHIGDYLYCLDTSEKDGIIFERTNLNDIRNKWDKISPDFENKKLKNFTNVGFAANLCINGKILLCGGDSVNMNTYLYDAYKNMISSNDKCEDILFTFTDKNFYKIKNNSSIALPYSLNEEKEILISNKNEYSLDKMNLTKKDKNKNEKLIFDNKYLKTQESLIGNVTIEFKTEEINDEKENGEINNFDKISNIENIDNIGQSNYSNEEIKTKTIKSCFTYIANNDNFINYKKEKKLNKNNDINFKYDIEKEENSEGNERNVINRKKLKRNYAEAKSEIKLNFNDIEGFFEPEGNNFFYDSNLSKFTDIKANNESFNSNNINHKTNEIKKQNNINNYINNISNNKDSNNKKIINNIESDIEININKDNDIIDDNEIKDKESKKEKVIICNKDNNNNNIIDNEEKITKGNNLETNDDHKINAQDNKDLKNINAEEKENKKFSEECKNNSNDEAPIKTDENKDVEEYEEENIIINGQKKEQNNNNDEEHNELHIENNVDGKGEENNNMQDNNKNEAEDFIEDTDKEEENEEDNKNNEGEEENNEEELNIIEKEEMNEDEGIEEYKDEMEVEEKENNENNIEDNENEEDENREMEMNAENEEKVDEPQERDKFQQTITQRIDEDIIQIANANDLFYYDENNFCDYIYIIEEIKF